MSTETTRRIQDLTHRFVDDLTEIARQAILAKLNVPRSTTKRTEAVLRNGERQGAKRSAAELDALKRDALRAIDGRPDGIRVEELNRELDLRPGVLALPIKHLLAAKAIRTTGTRRATRYFIAKENATAKVNKAKGKPRHSKRAKKK